ncbi:DUF6421 family protein [Vibrio lentus]|uniref:Uncharacterized protein n=1 Tax=Vibrio lentus TaxID=136468 RepID=A0AB36XLA4_9VIBR|nr:DUF6421 family protein [Vibrio lentus]MCC4836915.1 DUF6421 family protein [Vibrio lentus]PMI14266.1 hypothetical protein BCU51_09210 [Vibrio lentus]PMK29824.1 hypothetical protein BCU02_05690 [Vibrio lentus]PMK45920.1 hypothetical protein BCT99_22635 [Vibrio lentus]PML29236.1 hypothetical protein BCT79_05215 [Vibrio lentus]
MKEKLLSVGESLSDKTNQLRLLQDAKGQVFGSFEKAQVLLNAICVEINALGTLLNCETYASAIIKDIINWQKVGLESEPDFIHTRTDFAIPENNQWTFFFGPYLLANETTVKGKGYRAEFFIALRDDPQVCADLHKDYPHPRNICQSVRVLTGSEGILSGNALVFFPENILCHKKMVRQHFAIFFFNKFEGIYRTFTLPNVKKLFGENDIIFNEPNWLSDKLTTKQFYEARCVWGYLHDLYHHQGPRPFDKHVYIKMKWHLGLLEEIKVDCQTILTLIKDESLPYRKEVVELILFERLIRYPQELDAESNFDSGTGIFLLEWLLRNQAAAFDLTTMKGSLDWPQVLASLEILVEKILAFETLDDDAYIEQSARFLEKYLTLSQQEKRYLFAEHHHQLFPQNQAVQKIDFSIVEMY